MKCCAIKSRNLLFNHLGLGEDEMKIVLRPDCADLPYFLRAYFAFKMGLPFGYLEMLARRRRQPPTCFGWASIQSAEASEAAGARRIVRRLFADTFADWRSLRLAGRTRALIDDNTDYYPVPLKQETLRPGTIYADPYGHILVLVKRVPQTATARASSSPSTGSPTGPSRASASGAATSCSRRIPRSAARASSVSGRSCSTRTARCGGSPTSEIAKNPQYGDFSLDQTQARAIEDFYDRMDDVMSPAPLDPLRAMKEAITSLEEQVKTRVTSVENGRKFQNSGKGEAYDAGRRRRSSRRPARGRISRRRRATCAC